MLPVFANANVVHAREEKESSMEYYVTEEELNMLMSLMQAIESIPDELLENCTSHEINSYMLENGVHTKIYNDNIGETKSGIVEGSIVQTRGNWFKCSLALGQLVVTDGIPATQITKIKKYISALGGLKSAAKLLVGATTATEKLQGTLIALGDVLATITGVASIYEHCHN